MYGYKWHYLFGFVLCSLLPDVIGQQCGTPTNGISSELLDCSFTPRSRRRHQSTDAIVSSIVGGDFVSTSNYPWQVKLNVCGGSVIGPRHVLTAAHCLTDDLEVLLGYDEVDLSNLPRGIKVTKKIPHPDYSEATLHADIAVLELDTPIEYNDRVKPVCLPDGSSPDSAPSGIALYVSGYGTLGKGIPSDGRLRAVCVPAQETSVCSRAVGGGLTESMFCAGYYDEAKDSCQGDSGGPLVEIRNGRAIQRGIVSWGIGCGDNIPGVYTNVDLYVPWINSIVQR